jgi:hypothetical protein
VEVKQEWSCCEFWDGLTTKNEVFPAVSFFFFVRIAKWELTVLYTDAVRSLTLVCMWPNFGLEEFLI